MLASLKRFAVGMPDLDPGVHGFFPSSRTGTDRVSPNNNQLLTMLVYQNLRASGAHVLV